MERTVNIDGKAYTLRTNGATPRIYRGLFKKDIFHDMSGATNAKGEILDSEVFENLAYCMAIQGGSVSSAIKIEDWLGGMSSPLAIIEAAPDIMLLWADETATTSTEKKE